MSSAGMPAMGLAEPCDWQSDTHCTYPWDYNSASSSMEETGAHTSSLRVAECLPRVVGGVSPGGGLARGCLLEYVNSNDVADSAGADFQTVT